MTLTDLGQAVAYEAAFAYVQLDDPDLPLDEHADLTLDLAVKLRTLAIIELLVNADADAFHHHLMRNGRIRLGFLERLRREGAAHHHGVSGRIDAVIDLLAAGDFATVGAIAALSPAEWQPGREYEDDFCHAQMLFRLAAGLDADAAFDSLMQRHASAVQGGPQPRADICHALARRDQAAFDAAFGALLKARLAQIREDKARSQTLTPEVAASREVYVEGLAMLRLATDRCLATQREYLLCPSIARVPVSTPLPE
jgi:hypothetical protein